MLTIAEGDYIIAIYRLADQEAEVISFKQISSYLDLSVATVSATAKRLAKKDLLEYIEYKGVVLTNKGFKKAKELINAHFIWEVFLVNKLGLPIDSVHEEAHKLEHATSKRVLDALYLYLDSPSQSPHGKAIDIDLTNNNRQVALNSIDVNERVNLVNNTKLMDLYKELNLNNTPVNISIIKIYGQGDYLVEDQAHQRFIIPSSIVKDTKVVK